MALSTEELQEFLAFAHRLADVAGAAILPFFRQAPAERNKSATGGFDPVTAADHAAEEAMRQLIRQRYPEHGIFGEEQGRHAGSGALTWVLDPIDGTRAFLTGIPLWGTLIALNDGTAPVLGVMDQPFTGERFVGSALGAWFLHRGHTTPLRVRACTSLGEARLQCTDPRIFQPKERAAFDELQSRVQLTRFSGDCYAYCMVALGCIDLVVESGLQPYDVQALIPIIERAGGVMTNWRGGDCSGGGQVIAAGDPRVHAQALEILAHAAASTHET
ncbi:MAG: histidinol-phosphatase [Candidatus Binatia bacterium]|nr:histidinol-phosphatase [Candidatus Binatia bacterium]